MPSLFTIPKTFRGFQGYTSRAEDAPFELLAPPSQNCMVLENGKAVQRLGYMPEFSIGVDGATARAFYHETYDVAFFALGTKIYYHDFTTQTTHDTGLNLTDGTITRFEEWYGIVFCTNTTDGMRMIICGRLNDAAANAGDATVTIDVDMAGRLAAFNSIAPIANGSLVISGAAQAMTSLVVSTGVVTLDGTLSASFPDNRFCLVASDISGGYEKFSKVVVWKSRLHGIGYPSAANADHPNNTALAGDFVIGATGATGIEGILNFGGSAGATKINVGSGGALKNILGVADNLYFLNECKTHSASSADISTSGSSIGLTIPDEKDGLHGCFNEDCAALMGNEAFTYLTNDRRIMRQRIDPDTGTPLDKPEEDFDTPIREHLKNLDKDQTGAFIYHFRGGRQTIYQLKESGQWKWFIWDSNILTLKGGAWQPPQIIIPVASLFERNGVLYGTDSSDDTVYSFFTSLQDDQAGIECAIATGEFDVGNSMMRRASLQGEITHGAKVSISCFVTNKTNGRRTGSAKIINGADYTYGDNLSVGALMVGTGGVSSQPVPLAKWQKDFDIFPSEAYRAQLILTNFEEGSYFSLSSYSISGEQYPHSFQAAL